jgi:hypothetical protein
MYVNAKMIPVKLLQEWGERGIKGSGGEGELKYDVFDTL